MVSSVPAVEPARSRMNTVPDPARRTRRLQDRERDGFVNCLTAEAIPSRQRPFYVMRVDQLLGVMNGRGPASLEACDIGALLSAFGRRGNLLDRHPAVGGLSASAALITLVRALEQGALLSEAVRVADGVLERRETAPAVGTLEEAIAAGWVRRAVARSSLPAPTLNRSTPSATTRAGASRSRPRRGSCASSSSERRHASLTGTGTCPCPEPLPALRTGSALSSRAARATLSKCHILRWLPCEGKTLRTVQMTV